MTPITDRRAALAFVNQYAFAALSAKSRQRAASLANWILLNRTGMEPDDLPAAADEYRAERADWLAKDGNLDAFLAPAPGDAEFEDGVSRRVVLELLARKINRLQSSAQGQAILARMMATVCAAAPAHALWTSGSNDENEAMSDFFVSVRPHIARVPPYLLDKYRLVWRKLPASELPHAQPESFKRTLRRIGLGDDTESHAVKNFIVMLGDTAHGTYADTFQTSRLMKRRIDPSASAPLARRRTLAI